MFDRPYCLIDTPDAWTGFDSLAELAVAIHAVRGKRGLDLSDDLAVWGDRPEETRPSIGINIKERDGKVVGRRIALTQGETRDAVMAALQAARPARKAA